MGVGVRVSGWVCWVGWVGFCIWWHVEELQNSHAFDDQSMSNMNSIFECLVRQHLVAPDGEDSCGPCQALHVASRVYAVVCFLYFWSSLYLGRILKSILIDRGRPRWFELELKTCWSRFLLPVHGDVFERAWTSHL